MNQQKLQLAGLHHLTAITARAKYNHDFYTGTLGMRLVKKTVNQDDVSAYHLFYADGEGTPGTDLTFFDWPAAPERRGSDSIVSTTLRVPPGDAIDWWKSRLQEKGVSSGSPVVRAGRKTLDFEDAEGQRLSFVEDSETGDWAPWQQSPVPADYQIRGLGPVTLSVRQNENTGTILTELLGMREAGEYEEPVGGGSVKVFTMGNGGAAAEVHIRTEPELLPARQGAGAVHHVAFRVPTFTEYDLWQKRLAEAGMPSSGPVDRFYFRSLYFRLPNGILFELATDEPGFTADEPQESLGQQLALPPFLEGRRQEIEAGLNPLD